MDEGGSRSRVSLSEGALEGNLERGSFTGDPGGCVKEGSGNGHLSP